MLEVMRSWERVCSSCAPLNRLARFQTPNGNAAPPATDPSFPFGAGLPGSHLGICSRCRGEQGDGVVGLKGTWPKSHELKVAFDLASFLPPDGRVCERLLLRT